MSQSLPFEQGVCANVWFFDNWYFESERVQSDYSLFKNGISDGWRRAFACEKPFFVTWSSAVMSAWGPWTAGSVVVGASSARPLSWRRVVSTSVGLPACVPSVGARAVWCAVSRLLLRDPWRFARVSVVVSPLDRWVVFPVAMSRLTSLLREGLVAYGAAARLCSVLYWDACL